MIIEFTIPGVPVGKGRPKFARRGNFVRAYTPEKTASYENLVKLYAAKAMGGNPPTEEAVSASIVITINPPESWSQKKKSRALSGELHPTSKPDIDNVIKGIFDAMNDIVWRDDKQVVHTQVLKHFGEIAQASVIVIPAQHPKVFLERLANLF